LDPDCAMAHWGVAYASGSNYNKPWEAFLEQERAEALARSRTALQRAQATSMGAKPLERALIAALAARYPEHGLPDGADTSALPFQAWNDAYADAMRGVYREFGYDPDIATLFAEALINRTPW